MEADAKPHDEDSDPTAQEAADTLQQLREELAGSDPALVIANHCYGLFELAAVYLSTNPPKLPDAQLAIDALAGLFDATRGRLKEAEAELEEALSQLRLAYVQIHAATSATNGDGAS